MRPFISVIVVTYNSQNFIADCLKSIFRAECKVQRVGLGTEVIVVDNASQDETVRIVRQFNGMQLIANHDNLGFAAGVNVGARDANGEWLLVLNPDCVLDENAFVALNAFVRSPVANRHLPIAIIGLQLLNPDGSLQPSGRRFPTAWEFALATLGFRRWMDARWFTGRNFSQVQEVDEVSGAAFAVRREAFEQVGGMDDSFFLFFEDLDLCRRIKAAGWRIVYLPDAKVKHAWGASVKQAPVSARLAQQHSALRFFRKHHGCVAATLVRMALLLQQLGRFLRRPQIWHLISFALLLSPEKPFHHWRHRLTVRCQ